MFYKRGRKHVCARRIIWNTAGLSSDYDTDSEDEDPAGETMVDEHGIPLYQSAFYKKRMWFTNFTFDMSEEKRESHRRDYKMIITCGALLLPGPEFPLEDPIVKPPEELNYYVITSDWKERHRNGEYKLASVE